jgi:hypothetical protein
MLPVQWLIELLVSGESDNGPRRRGLLEFMLGPLDEDIDPIDRLQRLLLVVFSAMGGYFIGILLVALMPSFLSWPELSASFFWVIAIPLAIIWWCFKAALIFVLPTVAIYRLFNSFPGVRLPAYALIGVLWGLSLIFSGSDSNIRKRTSTSQIAAEELTVEPVDEVVSRPANSAIVVDDPGREQAIALVNQSKLEAARLPDLTRRVQDKWRADIEAANAFGAVGVVPPMLDVQEAGAHVRVTNLHRLPVCLRLTRIARNSTRPNDVVRCVLDSETCRVIAPGGSHRFQLFRSGNSPDCFHSALEYRVGTPLDPEPTWWSRTALEEYDAAPRAESPGASRLPSEIIAMTRKLELQLADTDRARRWREGLP